MAKVNFYLVNTKHDAANIRAVFNYSGGRLVYYVGEKIKPALWNAEAQRVRKNAPGSASINSGIDRVEALILEIFRRYRNDGLPLPPDRFRDEIDAAWKGKALDRPEQTTLFEFWERLNEERRVSPNYATNTHRAYNTALHKIQAFAKSTRRRVDFDTINLDFHGQLIAWMSKQEHSPNFIHKVVAVLKVVMSEAMDRKLHSNTDFQSRKFTVKTFTPEHIYLSESEIASIAAVSLPPGGRLDKARDLFLIGCYTGLRFSDYSMLKPENITVFDGVEMLNVQTRKTRTRISIPIMQEARALLDKNGGKVPAAMTNQKLNQALKEVCRKAGIVEPVRIVSVRGGQRVEVVSDKCDLVSSHTARRSYATVEYLRALRSGQSWRPIMDILGMTKEQTFFRYVKVGKEVTAAAFAKARGG